MNLPNRSANEYQFLRWMRAYILATHRTYEAHPATMRVAYDFHAVVYLSPEIKETIGAD